MRSDAHADTHLPMHPPTHPLTRPTHPPTHSPHPPTHSPHPHSSMHVHTRLFINLLAVLLTQTLVHTHKQTPARMQGSTHTHAHARTHTHAHTHPQTVIMLLDQYTMMLCHTHSSTNTQKNNKSVAGYFIYQTTVLGSQYRQTLRHCRWTSQGRLFLHMFTCLHSLGSEWSHSVQIIIVFYC